MGKFAIGTVVLVLFPFSNLKGQKLRPAIVLANVEFDNIILCQITSKSYTSTKAISLKPSDFAKGGLPIVSYVRPDKLFTADTTIISSAVGQLTLKSKDRVLKNVCALFLAKKPRVSSRG